MKQNTRAAIIGILVMALCSVGVISAAEAHTKSVEQAKAKAIKELVGDAAIETATGKAQGFGGEISATVSYAGEVIVDLSLKADGETPNIGDAALAELKSKILEAHTIEGIDTVSGATLTSNGVFDAVRDAMGIVVEQPSDEELSAEAAEKLLPGSEVLEAERSENVLAVYGGQSGSYVVVAQGIGHYPERPIKVAVLLDASGTVQGFEVVYSGETKGFGSEVLQESHWNQYYGAAAVTRKSGGEGTRIDTVSGATETSVALYDCAKAALEQFKTMKQKQ